MHIPADGARVGFNDGAALGLCDGAIIFPKQSRDEHTQQNK